MQWKHTNFRTKNAVATRRRCLVLQSITTVNNYEYLFAWYFGQDASLHYEVRPTGIVSTIPSDAEEYSPYGTRVAPGVIASNHQHLFCLRMDPAIDGRKNSLVVGESHPLPVNDPHVYNPLGVGYVNVSNTVTRETGLDLDFQAGRVFKVVNESVKNPTTGTPVGYKLLPQPSQLLLAHPSSYHARRSEFGEHAIWVTRYHDQELYASGPWTVQSAGGEGIASWIKQRANSDASDVKDQDIVIWHTFGITHNPRIEDWPVMPCEKLTVGLMPVNFFSGNPALDVVISTQETNKSVLVDGDANCCTNRS